MVQMNIAQGELNQVSLAGRVFQDRFIVLELSRLLFLGGI